MIKGISFLRPAGSQAAYDRLTSFFSALGFAPGNGWNCPSSDEKPAKAAYIFKLFDKSDEKAEFKRLDVSKQEK